MLKILYAFKYDPSLRNAQRVVQHAHKHPMSLCLLSVDELLIYDRAVIKAGGI